MISVLKFTTRFYRKLSFIWDGNLALWRQYKYLLHVPCTQIMIAIKVISIGMMYAYLSIRWNISPWDLYEVEVVMLTKFGSTNSVEQTGEKKD